MGKKQLQRGKQVPLVSNIAASALGAWAINWVSAADLSDQTQTAILSSIPPLVLMLAWFIKSVGYISKLSMVELTMSLSNSKHIKELKSTLDDPYIPEQKKEELREKYYEARMLKADIWANRVKLSSQGREELQSKFSEHIQNPNQENSEPARSEEVR